MTDKKIPKPEEIQKEFESFFKDKFGQNVQVVTQAGFGPQLSPEPELEESEFPDVDPVERILEFNLTPKQIKEHLDQYVIAQDDAKKALAIAVCDHYNYVKGVLENRVSEEQEYSKQNVLILGPTGVGKSYLIKQVAKLIGVPFVKADATRFSETGYMGANVDDLIKDLVKQADEDLDLAQFGIVYLDEADKLAGAPDRGGRDVSGRGVQFGLLKIMEESEVDLRGGHDVASQMQAFMDFQSKGKVDKKVLNTRFILFIVSGAFTGLDEIISKRVDANHIGFASEKLTSDEKSYILSRASTEDLIEYGFEPEFIGRLPIRVACHPLEKDHLYEILKNAKASIIRQYESAFQAYGIETKFTDDALDAIAELAYKQKTGARALMTVCEKILREYKFELPSSTIRSIVIDGNVILHPEEHLQKLLADAPEFDFSEVDSVLNKYFQEFEQRHEMKISLTKDARAELTRISGFNSSAIPSTLDKILRGYEHGLKLVEQNKGSEGETFILDKDVILEPQDSLERMIKESYQK